MSMLYVDVDAEQAEAYLGYLPDAIKHAINLKMGEVAELAQNVMKREAPSRTGILRRSIVIEWCGRGEFRVMPLAPYAKFVERGTAPHEIKPVKAKALRFPVMAPGGIMAGGTYAFAKRVFHPGTPANPFIARTREIVKNVMMKMVEAGIKEAIAG